MFSIGAVFRHWPLLVVIAAGTGLRLLAWYAIHPAWWFLGDSIDYVRDSVLRLPNVWRPDGYSFLLLLPLHYLHHLALVTAVQHLLGLTTGLLVYALLVHHGTPPWAAALAAAPALLDAYVVGSEQMLLSEPLFTVLVAGAVTLLLWQPSRPPLIAALLAGGMLGLAATTRTIGLILVAVAAVVLFRRLGALRLAVFVIAFSLPVAAYVAKFDSVYHRPNLTLSTGIFLYGRATQFADCGRLVFSDPSLRRLCPGGEPGQRGELFYVFDVNSPIHLINATPAATDDAGRQFSLAAIRQQPADYAALVARDFVHSFGVSQDGWVASNYLYTTNLPMPPAAKEAGWLYMGADPGPFYRPAVVEALAAYQRYAWVPGLACLAALLLAALGLVFGRDPHRRGLRSAVALTAGLALAFFLVPPFTVLPDPRFRLPAIPLLCLAVALSGRLLAHRFRQPSSRAGGAVAITA
jgi:hypothetical protein